MSLILSGIGMTVGGVVWLLLGLNANLFYPYSVVVIVLVLQRADSVPFQRIVGID